MAVVGGSVGMHVGGFGHQACSATGVAPPLLPGTPLPAAASPTQLQPQDGRRRTCAGAGGAGHAPHLQARHVHLLLSQHRGLEPRTLHRSHQVGRCAGALPAVHVCLGQGQADCGAHHARHRCQRSFDCARARRAGHAADRQLDRPRLGCKGAVMESTGQGWGARAGGVPGQAPQLPTGAERAAGRAAAGTQQQARSSRRGARQQQQQEEQLEQRSITLRCSHLWCPAARLRSRRPQWRAAAAPAAHTQATAPHAPSRPAETRPPGAPQAPCCRQRMSRRRAVQEGVT